MERKGTWLKVNQAFFSYRGVMVTGRDKTFIYIYTSQGEVLHIHTHHI